MSCHCYPLVLATSNTQKIISSSYSVSIQEILYKCKINDLLLKSFLISSQKVFGSEKLVAKFLVSTAYRVFLLPWRTQVFTVVITRSCQRRRFRDVPAEVNLLCASPWLLYFIHSGSGWLPLKKSRSRRKDFELQCCISNDNFTRPPCSESQHLYTELFPLFQVSITCHM